MQIVENWAWVTCRLEAVHDHGQGTELEVTVESTAPVPGFPDLLAQHTGRRVRITLGISPGLAPALNRFPGAIRGDTGSISAAG